MSFGAELKDFVQGFKTGADIMDKRADRKFARDKMDATREKTRGPTDAELDEQPGIEGSDFGDDGSAIEPPDYSSNEVYNDFMDTVKGGVDNPYALAAIASTADSESKFSPQNMTGSWSDPSESGQAGTAGGIMSWRGDRFNKMRAFVQSNQGRGSTAQLQAQFFLQENPGLIKQLNSASSLEEAQGLMNRAWQFAGYNRPGGEAANRMSKARGFLSKFQGQGSNAVADEGVIPAEGSPTGDTSPKAAAASPSRKASAPEEAAAPPTPKAAPQAPAPDPVIPAPTASAPSQRPTEVASAGDSGWLDPTAQLDQPTSQANNVTDAWLTPTPEELLRQQQLTAGGISPARPPSRPVVMASRGGVIPDDEEVAADDTETPIQVASAQPRYPEGQPAPKPAPRAAPRSPAPRQAPPSRGVIPDAPDYGQQEWGQRSTPSSPRPSSPGDRGEVAKALDGGIRFLQNFFGLGGGNGAIPTPDGQQQASAGIQRFAQGEGAATSDEIRGIDAKIDPEGQMPEGERQMQRLAKTMQWYSARGRGKEAQAAAGSLLQYGAQRFSQLGSLAGAAYKNYLSSKNPQDLDNALKFLDKAYELIPDGASFGIELDPQTHRITATRTDADGQTEQHVLTPQELSQVISGATNKSLYWKQVFRLADPAGARSREATEARTAQADLNYKRKQADTADTRAYNEKQDTFKYDRKRKDDLTDQNTRRTDEENRFERGQTAEEGRFERGQTAEEKRFERGQQAEDTRYQRGRTDKLADTKDERQYNETRTIATEDRADKRRIAGEDRAEQRAKEKIDALNARQDNYNRIDYNTVGPLLAAAQRASEPTDDESQQENQKQAADHAISDLYDALPPKDRERTIGEMGYPMGSWTYIDKALRGGGDTDGPDAEPDADADDSGVIPTGPATTPAAKPAPVAPSTPAAPPPETSGAKPPAAAPVTPGGGRTNGRDMGPGRQPAYVGDAPPKILFGGKPARRSNKDGAWYYINPDTGKYMYVVAGHENG